MPNWIGDAVMASPIPKQIKKKWPMALITLMASEPIASIFQKDPNMDKFLIFEKEESHRSLINELKSKEFDLGLLLTNSFSSAWLFYRAKIPYRVGYSKDFRSPLLSKKLPYPRKKTSEHMIQTYHKLLRRMGVCGQVKPYLYLSIDEKKSAEKFLAKCGIEKDQIIIGISPSAAFGSSKCWPEERYREVAQKLLENPKVTVLFFGDPKSEDKVKKIAQDLGNRAYNLAGSTSLRQLMALLSKCDLFLTNDSGPMHMGCALNTTTIALFGSTSPEATGPYHKSTFIRKKVACSPCFKRECPIDFRCMKAIEVDEVYQTLLEQLNIFSAKSWI